MECPIDSYPLQPKTLQIGSVYCCWKCEGIWLPYEVLREYARLKGYSLDNPDFENHALSQRIECPVDHGSMAIFYHLGAEIDMCLTCKGIWLDKGELTIILENLKASGNSSFLTDTSKEIGGEIVGEIFFQLIEAILEGIFSGL